MHIIYQDLDIRYISLSLSAFSLIALVTMVRGKRKTFAYLREKAMSGW